MKEIIQQCIETIHTLANSVVWLLSIVLSIVLSAIGYPKEILVFTMTLIVIDIITKHYSIVVINYGSFSIYNYFIAWRDRFLTSRGMKNGVGVKGLLYLPVLYIAHQASVIQEVLYGDAISSVLYSLLIVIEARSILENLADAGNTSLNPLIKFFKKKEKEITGDDE